jgi:DNA polymerase-3 subunit gamma/tau
MAHDQVMDGSPQDAASRQPGEYVVIARRYRPQSFEQLIGQEHVAKGLAAAITTSRVGHAYLFTGARGTGKTSTARILAKALNCVHGPTPTPCNECDICRSITAGDDMDVLEIDGASNRGIDEIRQLRQNVSVRPSRARFKVYIVDEVHMLTKEAFNALLKTLEEPPEHVKFIFCTTEPEKIPITILSRCQRFDFAGIQTKQIISRLRQIVEGEGVEAEPEALEILARRAAGSMRDSQSLLEQLLAFGTKKITVADVHGLLGTAGAERISRLVSHLVERNAAAAVADLDAALSQGVDVGQLLDQLLGYFRDAMAAAVGCPPEALLHVSASEQAGVQESARRLGLETILAVLQILDQTISRLKYLTYPRTVAELAVVRLCQLEDLDSLPQVLAQLRDGLPPTTGLAPSASSPTIATAKKKFDEPTITGVASQPPLSGNIPAGVPADQSEAPSGETKTAFAANGHAAENGVASVSGSLTASNDSEMEHAEIARTSGPLTASRAIPLDSETALAVWNQAVEQIGGLAGDMARQASGIAIRAPNQLVATFPAKYNSCKLFCERPEVVKRLAQVISQLVGQPVQLSFQLSDETPAEVQPARPVSHRQKMQEVCDRPYVRKAMEVFDATALRLEEPEQVKS